jgi:UDPglucose--hexose-1-phosphate uridylyltransferase
MKESELRLDPLRQTWTVFVPDRAQKPDFTTRAADRFEGVSPFLNGNEDLTHAALHVTGEGNEWQTRVVPNRIPVLRVEGNGAVSAAGFYDRSDGLGAHEIIVETPGEEELQMLSLPQIATVIDVWKTRMLDLTRDFRMRSFFIVKNVGAAAGATVRHSLSQLISMAVVPTALKTKLEAAQEFYGRKKRAIFEDLLAHEAQSGERMVYENNGFAVFCPYAARTPFEQAIYPKRQCPDFHGITEQEEAQLADVLKTALTRLDAALDRPAYTLALFTAPTRTARRDHWNTIELDFRWHIEIVPRLFYGHGFELATGCFLNTVWPETAAEHLRRAEV